MEIAETNKKQSKDAAKEERKKCVLDATIKCVKNNGFHSTSMAEIANEANISVGIIYRYFENKEAIIEAMVEKEIEERNIKFDKLHNTPDEELIRTFFELIQDVLERVNNCEITNVGIEIMSEAARNSRVANIVKKAVLHSSDAGQSVIKRIAPNLSNEYVEAYSDLFQIFFDGIMVFSAIKPDFNKKIISQIMLGIIINMTRDKP